MKFIVLVDSETKQKKKALSKMTHQIKFEILDFEDKSNLKMEDFSETEDIFESPKSENLDLESQNLSKSEKCSETIQKESVRSMKQSPERIKKELRTSKKQPKPVRTKPKK